MSFRIASNRNRNANVAFAQNTAFDHACVSPACVKHITPTLSAMSTPINPSNLSALTSAKNGVRHPRGGGSSMRRGLHCISIFSTCCHRLCSSVTNTAPTAPMDVVFLFAFGSFDPEYPRAKTGAAIFCAYAFPGCSAPSGVNATRFRFRFSSASYAAADSSFISLNLSMVTPTNRFMMKNEPTMMKTTKNTHAAGLASRQGCTFSSVASTPWYITSSHISSVAVSNNTSIAVPMWSKS